MREEIQYVASNRPLGLRGIGQKNLARLIPFPDKADDRQKFFAFSVDFDAGFLPYLPDMTEGSDFQKQGAWHYYEIQAQLLIAVDMLNKNRDYHWVIGVVWFVGEDEPKKICDFRQKLIEEGLLTEEDLVDIERLIEEKIGQVL